MNWPLRTPIRQADRMNHDIADLARDSDDLKRKNAELRRQLAETLSLLDVAREAGIAQAARLQQFERLLDALHDGAKNRPSQPLARWVKYGPMAAFLEKIKDHQ